MKHTHALTHSHAQTPHTEMQTATCAMCARSCCSACFYVETKCEQPTCAPSHKQENKHFWRPQRTQLPSPSDVLSLSEEPVNVTMDTAMTRASPHIPSCQLITLSARQKCIICLNSTSTAEQHCTLLKGCM